MNSLRDIAENFQKTLQDAKAGKKTSIQFIRHTLPSTPLLLENQTAQVMGVGGSVFEKSLVKKVNGKIELAEEKEEKLIHFRNGEEFLFFVEQELDKNTQLLGLNFAYPLSPVFNDGKLEGILLSGTKENNFGDLKGKNICKEIEKFIWQKRQQKIRVSVANDTICLALSGLTKFKASEMAAGIVGTGLNFAIFSSDTEVINLEAANFDEFRQSDEGKAIDLSSEKPRTALFEKEVSGAYLYQHFNLKAASMGLKIQLNTTAELNDVAKENSDEGKLAKELLQHSAELVACMISGIQMFENHALTFVMQGSLFWKADEYKDIVMQTAKEIAPEFSPRFEHIENSGLLGAAKLLG